jgi:hypothetical protein
VLGWLLLGSCAAPMQPGEVAPMSPPAQPSARLGLPPAYRVFHDELESYGDWILIEPYGYVFRPDVNTVAWRPYEHGWWEPSYVFGWVWNSDEPFGWITYHYGTWFYDDFQGWVWRPGLQWGPAWVAWVSVGDWIGWAPLGPASYDGYGDIPGGVFLYASATQFGRSAASMQATFVNGLARSAQPLRPIVRLGHADGVTFNKGPDPLVIERAGGAVPMSGDVRAARLELPAAQDDGGAALLQSSNRMVAVAEREWRDWRESGAPPKAGGGTPRPPVWRDPPTHRPLVKPLGRPVPADSTEHTAPRDSVRARPVAPALRDTTATRQRSGKSAPVRPGGKQRDGAPPDSTR